LGLGQGGAHRVGQIDGDEQAHNVIVGAYRDAALHHMVIIFSGIWLSTRGLVPGVRRT
jgi:hypothetical protein